MCEQRILSKLDPLSHHWNRSRPPSATLPSAPPTPIR